MLIEIIAMAIVFIYSVASLFIFSYSIMQMNLVIVYLKNKLKDGKAYTGKQLKAGSEPLVTVQLPIYNEIYVAERLLDCITTLEYPVDKLEIQVLDDSDDETAELIATKVSEYRKKGFNINHVLRHNREGFKAGALAYGLKGAMGEFIAIFDSDFLPQKDFLKKTIPVFDDDKIGMVQTRWDHLNKNYSLLTRLQAFGLDAHFSIEQKGRNAGNHFINFNGTAGVWRRKCIETSNGWQADTLTEDLDLSYRAQLKGWKFIYLEEVNSPAELPVTMNALKNQQYRWNKGAAECVKKILGLVLKDKKISVSTKLHSIFHLMNSSVFIAILISAFLSIPMLLIKNEFLQFHFLFFLASFILLSFLMLSVFYFVATTQKEKKIHINVGRFLLIFPLFLSVSMGMALHNAVAVIEGYLGKKTSFIRTPKFNLSSAHQSWKHNKYLSSGINMITILEGVLTFYFASGILIAFYLHDFGLVPFHAMLTFGFGFVFYTSLSHSFLFASPNQKTPHAEGIVKRIITTS
ncbi:MAG: cellulose synthase family protein [Chitinophagales bacterium]